MANAASLFSQLLRQFPRTDFAALVKDLGAEKHAKGFTCWDQFVSMLFCHLARADSLREICGGLACCLGKLAHLGVGNAPKKSTLSYATNGHRPAALYERLFWATCERFRDQGRLGGRRTRFRFKNKLMSLDSTTISLCLSLFPWADFRRAKGGVKVHVMLDHDDYLPSFVLITHARRHDVTPARKLRLPAGSIIAMDRAYNDFTLFAKWTDDGVFFVTRMKENTVFEVIAERALPQNRPIRADHVIRLASDRAEKTCPHPLRRVVVWDGRERPPRDRAAHQSPRFRRHHHRRHLQGTLADRAVLQGAQAEPQDQDLRRHLRERAAHPDLDSPDRHAAAQMAPSPLPRRMVALQSRRHGSASTCSPTAISGPGSTIPSRHRPRSLAPRNWPCRCRGLGHPNALPEKGTSSRNPTNPGPKAA